MYRTVLLIVLSTHAALGAPQERESSITYLKIQPPVTDKPVDTQNYRNYRVVPSNKAIKKFNKTQSIPVISDESQKDNSEVDDKITETKTDVFNATENVLLNSTKNLENKIESIVNTTIAVDGNESEVSPVIEDKSVSDPQIDESKNEKTLVKDTLDHLDNDPSESSQFDRHSKDYDYTTVSYESIETEIADYSTEKYEDLDAGKSSASLLPKLTFFQKFGGSFSHNLIESSGKRRFRSRCRCEKIWNCPKLQITVPRCPEEYFMCCF